MQIQLPSQIVSASLAMLAVAFARGGNLRGANLKSTLQAKYDSLSSAFSRKDATVFDHVFSSKYVLIGTNGRKVDRKELLADYKRQMAQMSEISWSRTLDSVSVSGSTAIATVHGRFKGFLTKPDGKHVFESVTSNKDTWTLQAGSWVLQKSVVLSLDATFDKRHLNRGK